MKVIRLRPRRVVFHTLLWTGFFSLLSILLLAAFILWLPTRQIAQGVWVGELELSGLTLSEAQQRLAQHLPPPPEKNLVFREGERTWEVSSRDLGAHWNTPEALAQAQGVGHQGEWWQQADQRLRAWFSPVRIAPKIAYEPAKVDAFLQQLAAEIEEPGQAPDIEVARGGYSLQPGEPGKEIQREKLLQQLNSQSDSAPFEIPTQPRHTPLTQTEQEQTEARLAVLWKKKILLIPSEHEAQQTLAAAQFFAWLDLPQGISHEALSTQLEEWETAYNHEPVNAQFERGKGNRLTVFEPHKNGRALQREELTLRLQHALEELETSDTTESKVVIPFTETEPETTLAETNDLGIRELLGVGTSTYYHSIPNRIFNVNLTAERIGPRLIAPGEEFSFAESVGEISQKTGFKTAYVIRNGRTELGDGGGVCQVSTTIFRAVLDAGLPITRWKNHSYRVSYYEQGSDPGFDATIYAPSVDFRFTNDTGNYLVLVPHNDPENLFLRLEIWGTSDGRTSEIKNYFFGNVRPAPAPLYQPDPSLPEGVRKQIDWAAAGATASFDYIVTDKEGNTRFVKTFRSVYQPWRAVYLVGTGGN